MEKILLIILFVHFFADFVLQSDKQAKGKSVSLYFLSEHVIVYSSIWFLFMICFCKDFEVAFYFLCITFFFHWITDFITSRVGKVFWDKGNTHYGFVVVGFDQILHYIQLFLTFKVLMFL